MMTNPAPRSSASYAARHLDKLCLGKWLTAFGFFAAIAIPGWAAAQQAESSTAVFDAWTLRCRTTTEKGAANKLCEVATTVTVKTSEGRTAVVMVVALGKPSGEKPSQLVLSSPTEVWLPHGIKLQDKAGKVLLDLPYLFCSASMCSASTPVSDPQRNMLSVLDDDMFALFRMRTGQDVKMKISLKGFSAASKAMLKESSVK